MVTTPLSTPAPTAAAAPPGTLIDFRDVAMKFPNGTVALSGVDINVKRGEFEIGRAHV